MTKVQDLISPIDGLWDEELIISLFWPIDVNIILEIPLSPGREDFVAWRHTKNGYFSVRSAYHAQWDHQFRRMERNSEIAEGANDNQVWKELWSLDIPAKIKIFGWRALHGIIPEKGILADRHVGNNGSFPICQMGC